MNYHNFIRPHLGLNEKTQAQVSDLDVNSNRNDILKNALHQLMLNKIEKTAEFLTEPSNRLCP